MIAFAYYLLKVSVCSGILYGYYHLALRNKAFHYWNRFYLLGTVLMSILLPLVKIPVQHHPEILPVANLPLISVVNSGDAYVESFTVISSNPVTATEAISLAYTIVSLGLLLFFIFTIWQIRNIIRRYEIIPMEGMAFLNTSEKGTPFSFLNYIFWNREIPADSESGKQILLHEIAHVRQKHSYDRIFIQCLLIVFWCNPIFWLIKKEIAMIHEFIADREAVKDRDGAAFAAMILQAAFPNHQFPVSNYFFHSPIKRRLKMLINSNKPGRSYLNRIMILPILLIVGAGFTLKVSEKSASQLDKVYTVVIDAGHGGHDNGSGTFDGLYEKDLNLAIAKKIKSLNKDQNLNLVLIRESDEYQSPRDKLPKVLAANPDVFISIHINAAPTSTPNGFEIYISENNRVLERENIALASAIQQEMKSIMSTASEIRRRQQKSIFILDSIAKDFPAAMLECGYISNPADRAFLQSAENLDKIAGSILQALKKYLIQKNQAITFTEPDKTFSAENRIEKNNLMLSEIPNDTIHLIADSIVYHSGTDNRNNIVSGKQKEELYLLPGKSLNVLSDTLPKGVKSVDFTEAGDVIVIFDNGKAERMSTTEAQKKGYVPIAILEKRNQVQYSGTVHVRGIGISGLQDIQPIIFVNGVRLAKGQSINALDQIVNPDDIESIDILKDEKATALYGEEAKGGVILIKTKGQYIDPVKEVTVVGYQSQKFGQLQPKEKVVTGKPINQVALSGEPVFEEVDTEASFKGGTKALMDFMYKKLESIVGSNKKDYMGNCTLQILVEQDGSLNERIGTIFTDSSKINKRLSEALVQIMKTSPAWIPAVQNGKNVRSLKLLNFSYPPMLMLKEIN